MATHKQAEKRARQSLRRHERNRHFQTKLVNAIKKLRATTDKKRAEELLGPTVSVIDSTVSKNVIHKNTANRYKSRLTKFVRSLTF
ncbi:MAG: 30S ribosomal protein S20 [Deltaproteobacteria bacterium]|nr:30S ribosomal protein S20 [Deltaproteobacteria bacterium]